MKNRFVMFAIAIMVMIFLLAFDTTPVANNNVVENTPIFPASDPVTYNSEPASLPPQKLAVEITQSPEPEFCMDEDDIQLIALLTMAEAEAEPEEGQRLVIDTVLNRMDDSRFPDNVYDVIYQPNQYSGMQPPRIENCWVKEELVQLVQEELEERTNRDVIFFRTNHYGKYGTPLFQVGRHYFSSY